MPVPSGTRAPVCHSLDELQRIWIHFIITWAQMVCFVQQILCGSSFWSLIYQFLVSADWILRHFILKIAEWCRYVSNKAFPVVTLCVSSPVVPTLIVTLMLSSGGSLQHWGACYRSHLGQEVSVSISSFGHFSVPPDCSAAKTKQARENHPL